MERVLRSLSLLGGAAVATGAVVEFCLYDGKDRCSSTANTQ